MKTITAPSLPGAIIAPQFSSTITAPAHPTTVAADALSAPGSILHFDGADGATTFTDVSGKVWTASGAAQIDTAQSKFGGASGLFSGADADYISTPAHADWWLDNGLDSSLWTISFWLRFVSIADPTGLIQQILDATHNWTVFYFGGGLDFRIRVGDTSICEIIQSWSPSINTWYHVAIVKNGVLGYMHFVDGTQLGTTTINTNTIPDFASQVQVGRYTRLSGVIAPLNGWIDELIVEKGIARWTSNFTPPTAVHSVYSTVVIA